MNIEVNFDSMGGGGDLVFTDTGATSLNTYTVPNSHKGIIIVLYRASNNPALSLNGVAVTPLVQKTVSGNNRVWIYEINNIKAGDVLYSVDFTDIVYIGFIDD